MKYLSGKFKMFYVLYPLSIRETITPNVRVKVLNCVQERIRLSANKQSIKNVLKNNVN